MTNTKGLISQFAMKKADLDAAFVPLEFLDGMLLPFSVATGLFAEGATGKSTSLLTASLGASENGYFSMFGNKNHGRLLRVLLVYAEDTNRTLGTAIVNSVPKAREKFEKGMESGNIVTLALADKSIDGGFVLFDKDGKLTDRGLELFRDIEGSGKFDLVVFDTLSTLSESEYLSKTSCYATVRELNGLAARTGAAVVYIAHTVKNASKGFTAEVTASEVIGAAAGSAGLINASRNSLILTKAPKGAYETLARDLEDGDELLLCAVKTNINPKYANKLMPILRSNSQKTFLAVDATGQTFADFHDEREAEVVERLETVMFHAIRAAAESLQPFAESGKMSPESLAADLLMPVTQGASKAQVAKAVDNLIRRERVKAARSTATGTPLLDVAGGPFANPELHLQDGKPPVFRKGAPDISGLASLIAEAVKEDLEAKDEDRRSRQERKAPW